MEREFCPDCGEILVASRGYIPFTAVHNCLHCGWNEVYDGDRQRDAKEDYIERYCTYVTFICDHCGFAQEFEKDWLAEKAGWVTNLGHTSCNKCVAIERL